MARSKPHIYKQTFSQSQIKVLNLPIRSKVLIELTIPHLESFRAGLGKELGYLTITDDGYILKIDSEDEEITNAYEYLRERVSEGCCVRFAPPSDKPVFYVWQSSDWTYNANRILTISRN